MSFLDKAEKRTKEEKSPPKPTPPPKLPEPKEEKKPVPVVLPKYQQIIEYVEKWKQAHPPPYQLKCKVCGETYQDLVKKCKNGCQLRTQKTKKKKKTLITYWEEVWPYEKTLLNKPKLWKGLIQSILEIAEMIMNE